MTRTGILILLILLPAAVLRAQWYVDYEKGREAVKNGQWQQGVALLTRVIEDEPDSKANKKTYGFIFIDYFPYLYRGIAYYRLGDIASARADLSKAKDEGVIDDRRWDKDAGSLLTEYLGYLQKQAPPIAQQKTPQTPAQNPPQNPPQKTVTAPTQPETKKSQAAAEQRTKREEVEKAFTAGKEFFDRDDLDRAEEQFRTVLGLEPNHRGALNFMNRIQTARQRLAAAARKKELPAPPSQTVTRAQSAPAQDTAGSSQFREAISLLNSGKIGGAKSMFLNLQKNVPSYPELANYLGLIADVENKVHLGIEAFVRGEYGEAIEQLRSSSRNGHDNPHVYAFLACSYAAEYLLTGAENRELKKEAIAAFGKVKGLDARYELDQKLISPGIIALLREE